MYLYQKYSTCVYSAIDYYVSSITCYIFTTMFQPERPAIAILLVVWIHKNTFDDEKEKNIQN